MGRQKGIVKTCLLCEKLSCKNPAPWCPRLVGRSILSVGEESWMDAREEDLCGDTFNGISRLTLRSTLSSGTIGRVSSSWKHFSVAVCVIK